MMSYGRGGQSHFYMKLGLGYQDSKVEVEVEDMKKYALYVNLRICHAGVRMWT